MPAPATSPALTVIDPAAEVHRQADLYIELGYPALAGMDDGAFHALIEPLAQVAGAALAQTDDAEVTASTVPLVLVVTSALVDPAARQALTHLAGSAKPGIVDKNHGDEGLAPYRPLPELEVSDAPVYLLAGVERGEEFRGVAPEQALPVLTGRGRTPLTIDEGISLVTQFPGMLEKNHCFMLSGSRRGDRRVPAMWISERAPKLGWCWDGNPHDWLGVASAKGRVAA